VTEAPEAVQVGDRPVQAAGGRPLSRARRVAVGAGLVVALGVLLAVDATLPSGFLYAAAAAAVVAVALDEFCTLAARAGMDVPHGSVVPAGTVLFVAQWAGWTLLAAEPWLVGGAVLCASTMGLLADRALRGRIDGAFQAVCGAVAAWVYIPLMLGFLTGIRAEWGTGGLVVLLAVCKGSSTGAYLAGTLVGGRKLIPRVSPGKTVAGLFGGLAAAVAVSWLLGFSPVGMLTAWAAAGFGLLIGVAAVVGDLAESLLKRQAGVKDSRQLVPGLGGMLDMVDDVLFAAPVAFLLLQLWSV
jgi:phosphatidate cytidylyltransferase